MKIDFGTGKVYYTDVLNENPEEIKKSLEDMKIKDVEDDVEPIFQKTRHRGLPYGRLKYMFYCFLLMVDGLIGIVSIGQTQSFLAQKYLLSDWVIGDYNDRQNGR